MFQLRWGNGFSCPRYHGDRFYFLVKRMLYGMSILESPDFTDR
ncbi:hypothetical protein JZ785_03010 [Alicyclobacillus curvatus]|nr:hypothetical protein JZ785_03010 [Alicyclobacillus curvatus]